MFSSSSCQKDTPYKIVPSGQLDIIFLLSSLLSLIFQKSGFTTHYMYVLYLEYAQSDRDKVEGVVVVIIAKMSLNRTLNKRKITW